MMPDRIPTLAEIQKMTEQARSLYLSPDVRDRGFVMIAYPIDQPTAFTIGPIERQPPPIRLDLMAYRSNVAGMPNQLRLVYRGPIDLGATRNHWD